ncbi:unnamed protein product [Leptosia nina]|uniref:Uncharacterized protein n=1 Tax=Leptosia nina TaxID=320188 RepID=A0AAV1JHY8_9NEOP
MVRRSGGEIGPRICIGESMTSYYFLMSSFVDLLCITSHDLLNVLRSSVARCRQFVESECFKRIAYSGIEFNTKQNLSKSESIMISPYEPVEGEQKPRQDCLKSGPLVACSGACIIPGSLRITLPSPESLCELPSF